jgi:hypothetical protein
VAPSRQIYARFLILFALVYAGLAAYFVSTGLYAPALSTALAALAALIVARAIRLMSRGKGPSVGLALAFAAVLIGANIIIWRAVS